MTISGSNKTLQQATTISITGITTTTTITTIIDMLTNQGAVAEVEEDQL